MGGLGDWEDWDDHIFDWMDDSRPMVELNYGIGTYKHNDLVGEFNEVGSVDFKLGYSTIDVFMDDYILEFSEKIRVWNHSGQQTAL